MEKALLCFSAPRIIDVVILMVKNTPMRYLDASLWLDIGERGFVIGYDYASMLRMSSSIISQGNPTPFGKDEKACMCSQAQGSDLCVSDMLHVNKFRVHLINFGKKL